MSARGGKKRQKSVSRSAKAGVLFPVGRMHRYLKARTHKFRISAAAPVYQAAVIEYLTGRKINSNVVVWHCQLICYCSIQNVIVYSGCCNRAKAITHLVVFKLTWFIYFIYITCTNSGTRLCCQVWDQSVFIYGGDGGGGGILSDSE